MEDQYVETVLGRIRLRVGGSGPAMLFWPSLLMDGTLWSAQASYFVERFQVIKPVIDAFLGPTAKKTKPAVVAAVNDSVRRVAIGSGRRAVVSVVLEKAAHLAALESPDEVNVLIDGFLADHS